jgi:catalase
LSRRQNLFQAASRANRTSQSRHSNDDATSHWPEDGAQPDFGTIALTAVAPDDDEHRKIIFDPIPRVDGIDSSGDPLLDARADAYLISGRRRRAAAATA